MAWGAAAAKGIDDLVARVARDDPKLTSLHILKLRKFGPQQAAELFGALNANTTLTELYTSGHAMGVGTVQQLAQTLAINTTLRSLCVGDGSFGDQEVSALAVGLLSSKSVQKVDLENKDVRQEGAAALAKVLQGSPSLGHLVLSRNPLGDGGAAALRGGTWKSLSRLDLASCQLTHVGVEALALTSMPHLTILNLASNPLGASGGAAAGKLLASAPRLQRLLLAGTQLADAGVACLAAAVGTSTCLQELDISSCSAASTGCEALAAAVAGEACPLQRLVLADNPDMPPSSLQHLAGAVAASPHLVALDLARAQVNVAGLSFLAAAPALEQLTLLGCTALGQASPDSLLAALCHPPAASSTPPTPPTPASPAPPFTTPTPLPFPALTELNLAGCELQLSAVQALLQHLQAHPTAALPKLKVLALGANEATEHDELEQLLQSCQEARPQLQLHWRSGDGFENNSAQQED